MIWMKYGKLKIQWAILSLVLPSIACAAPGILGNTSPAQISPTAVAPAAEALADVSLLTATTAAVNSPQTTAGEAQDTTLQFPTYDPAELEVIARLNEWRVGLGLWPLRVNDDLRALALDQATYLQTLQELPEGGNIHLGRRGENAMDRAYAWGWPAYHNAQQIAVGEIAYAGAGLSAALDFWNNSSIHNATISKDAFREIGVVVVPYQGANLYIAVLAGQPDVIPALVDPATKNLYLASERFRWSTGGTWIHDVKTVQVGSSSQPVAWQPVITAPPFGTTVIYSDGERMSEVTLGTGDVAWLPGNLSLNGVMLTLPSSTAEQPSDSASASAAPASQPTPIAPTDVPAPAIPTAIPPATEGNVAIVYDQFSLSIVNIAGRPVNLSGLSVDAGGHHLPATRWVTEWMSVPIEGVPDGDCLQVWAINELEPLEPPGCRARVSGIYLEPVNLFWVYFDFEIRNGAQVLANCTKGSGTCLVTLP